MKNQNGEKPVSRLYSLKPQSCKDKKNISKINISCGIYTEGT